MRGSLGNDRPERIGGDRFDQVGVEPGSQRALAVLGAAVPGERDEIHGAAAELIANGPADLVAVDVGKADVDECDVRWLANACSIPCRPLVAVLT